MKTRREKSPHELRRSRIIRWLVWRALRLGLADAIGLTTVAIGLPCGLAMFLYGPPPDGFFRDSRAVLDALGSFAAIVAVIWIVTFGAELYRSIFPRRRRRESR